MRTDAQGIELVGGDTTAGPLVIGITVFGELPAGAPEFPGLVPMLPSPDLAATLPDSPRPDALPAYLADPNGYLVLRYAPGFNPSGLRKDLGRVLK